MAASSRHSLLAAGRPAEELEWFGFRRQRRDPHGLERVLELAPFRIGERGLARLADRRSPLRVGGERAACNDRIQDAQEAGLGATMRLAVALDQPATQRDLEAEPEIAPSGGTNRFE